MAVLLLLLLLTATQAMLFMRGQTPVWSVLLMGFALAAYLSAAVFWISKPYRRAEKTMERFLDGYIIPAGDREKERFYRHDVEDKSADDQAPGYAEHKDRDG